MAISSLDDETFAALRSALSASPLALNPDELIERISTVVPDETEVADWVDAILSLSSAVQSHRWPLQATVDEAAAQIHDARPNLPARMRQLLEDRNVALTAKSVSLSHETISQLHSMRLITDLRPVFDRGDDGAGDPVGMIVLTSLRMTCLTESGLQDLCITITDEQLATLSQELKWATRKVEALQRLVERVELPLHHHDE